MNLEYRLLGPLEVRADGRLVPINSAKQRVLLATLLVHAGRVVATGELIHRLWGDDVPAGARNTLQSYVMRLRRTLGTDTAITTRPDGYLIQVPPDALDTTRFEALVLAARTAEDPGKPLREALGLWRGEPFADIPSDLRDDMAAVWRERRLAAFELRIDADLKQGRHQDVATELADLTATHPERERFWTQRMLALYRSGRAAEAVRCYTIVRKYLADELGVDPGPELRDLHRAILTEDATLAAPAPAPRRRNDLPGDIPDFVGRTDEFDQLRGLLPTENRPAAAVVITAIDGMAGIGKTALAVHAAHQLADRYPDAQIFIDLRAHTANAEPVEPLAALDTLLRALDVPPERIPADLDQRAALWRSELAHRKVLLVLDNASATRQVRPLLPGSPTCLALITSRQRLADLDTAATLSLDVLPEADALALFASVVGRDRAASESTVDVLRLCGHLPLAIRIAAARLRTRPAWTVDHLADRLRDERRRLAELTIGDRSVAAAFALSYRRLAPERQRLFRLLGLHPGTSFDAFVATAIGGTSLAETERTLESLVDAQLLREPEPGRYQMHDLLRDHARALAEQSPSSDAVRRMLDYYLCVARRTAELIAPSQKHIEPHLDHSPAEAPHLSTTAEAVEWCQREHHNLVAMVRLAATTGEHTVSWQLAHVLWHYFYFRYHLEDWIATHLVAVESARLAGDREGYADTVQHLSSAYRLGSDYPLSIRYNEEALAIYREIGDRFGEANTLNNLGNGYVLQGRFAAAFTALRASLVIRREIGDPWNEGHALMNLGVAYHNATDYAMAEDCYQQAYERYRSVNDKRCESMAISNMAEIRRLTGDWEGALPLHRQAIDLTAEIGDLSNMCVVLNGLAETCLSAGRTEEAESRFQEALALATDIGDRAQEAGALQGLGDVAHSVGKDSAYARWQEALAIYDSIGSGAMEAQRLRDRLDQADAGTTP